MQNREEQNAQSGEMAQAHDVTVADSETFCAQDKIASHKAVPDEQIRLECEVAAASKISTRLRRSIKAKDEPPSPSLAMTTVPLLICSVGNPGAAYAHTLHSAGHTVLQALAGLMQTSGFTKDRSWGNGLVTRSYSPELPWTLWQSTSYMNESGKGVSAAYKTWQRELIGNSGRIVVLHDEMEKPLGSVTVRDKEGLSAKGHNGLKSCISSLGPVKFVRVGVGIGRPVSRDSNDVSRFVLRKMTPAERLRIEEAAGDVLTKLMALRG